jgi:ferredoxin
MTTTNRLRVTVDRDRCVGSTLCVQFAPGAFVLDEKKQAVVADLDAVSEETLRNAAEQCPLMAITIENTETGERFP